MFTESLKDDHDQTTATTATKVTDELAQKSQEALVEAHKSYAHKNPNSFQAYQLACESMPGGNTRTVLHALPFPLTFSSGDASILTSVDGETYVDFLGEYTAGIYGHNHPAIRSAIDKALDKGWSYGGTNMYEKELAKLVCERFSPTIELVRFTNSGTEANMMAVAAAIAFTGKKKILVFEKGYHGATLSFRMGPAGSDDKNVNLPHEWVVGTYNDIEQTQRVLSHLPRDSLAAILVEPMLGSGGAIPGKLEFLEYLREYASSNHALLIFDEVMTSRLSYRGQGHQMGIRPDMMTLGKWVGGGMSFGAFGGRRDIMEMFDPRSGSLAHAGTFNNNMLSMAAGCAGCKILDKEATKMLNDLGDTMAVKVQEAIDEELQTSALHVNGSSNGVHKDHLNGNTSSITSGYVHCERTPAMWISGIGSILTVHFTDTPMQATLLSLFYHHMLREGIYLAERGFVALNINLRIDDIDAFAAATRRFVAKYTTLITGRSSL